MLQFAIIGIGAGLASALLFLSPLGGTPLAFPLFFLCGLPVAIAGLAWNAIAAAIAAATGSVVIAVVVGPEAAGIFLFVFGVPLAWLSRLVLLSRAAAGAVTEEWFPLGRILLHAAVAAAIGVIIAGIIVGFDPQALAADMSAMLADWFVGSPEFGPPPTQAELAPFVRLNVSLMPFTVPAITLLLVVFNLWLASRIAYASGRLQRPREALWTAALPREALVILVVAIAAAFLPGPVGYAASTFAGAIGGAAALVGLAVIHAVTLGLNLRVLILVATYVLAVFFGFPIFIFALLGFAEGFLQLRARRLGGAPPPAT